MTQQTAPPGASEFNRYIQHTRKYRELPDMSLNGNMGAYSKWAQELSFQFKQHGYDGFERSLQVLHNNERLVMTALSMPSPDKDPEEVGVLLSDVKPEAIHWLWPGYLALRKLHTFDGDPGLGKSTLLFHIIARLTIGEVMPGEERTYVSGGAVLVCLEDGLEDTIQPRLAKAGADLSKIVSIGFIKDTDVTGVEREKPFNLGTDGHLLEAAIKRVNAKIVMIDPVMAILGGKDIYKDNEVRAALTPLKEIAERCNVAIVMIRHITKGGSDKAIYLGGGSIAFIGLSRIGWLAVRNPDNEEQCIFANIKNNLGKPAPKLLYSVVSDVGSDDERPYIRWEGESKHTDQELMSKPTQNQGESRQAILKVLKKSYPESMSPAQIANELGLDLNRVTVALTRMFDAGQIEKLGRGKYVSTGPLSASSEEL
jgi:AAA domain